MRTPHPGTVASDAQAFEQISSRFQDEVGRILSSIDFTLGPVPFWALTRMMFPVVESLGDLIYRQNNATARNLRSVLEKEFESVRAGYAGKAALLTLLYRHSLTHHDELLTLTSGRKEIGWSVNSADDANHLYIRTATPGFFILEFQPRAFYTDIVKVCGARVNRKWSGEVMKRYNRGMSQDIESRQDSTAKAARTEMESL